MGIISPSRGANKTYLSCHQPVVNKSFGVNVTPVTHVFFWGNWTVQRTSGFRQPWEHPTCFRWSQFRERHLTLALGVDDLKQSPPRSTGGCKRPAGWSWLYISMVSEKNCPRKKCFRVQKLTLFFEVVFFFQAIFGYHEPPTTPWKNNYGFGHLKNQGNFTIKAIQSLDIPKSPRYRTWGYRCFFGTPKRPSSITEVWRFGCEKNTDPSSRERYLED